MLRSSMLAILAAAVLSGGAAATTVRVDGTGDGDNDGTDDFDTIAAALAGTSPAVWNDGQPDTVAIMVNKLTEPSGFQLNTPSSWGVSPVTVTDDWTLDGDGDGDGTWCEIRTDSKSFGVGLRSGQAAAFRRCKIFTGNQHYRDLITVTAPEGVHGASVTVEDVWLTAADGRGNAANPAVNASYRGVDAISVHCAAFHAHGLPENSEIAFTFRRLSAGFHRAAAIEIEAAESDVLLEDCLFQQNGYNPYFWSNGGPALQITAGGRMDVRLDRARFIDNDTGAASIWANGPDGDLSLWVGPGCEIRDNFWNLFRAGSEADAHAEMAFAGTREDPILVHNNFRGMQLTLSEGSSLEATELLVCDTDYEGLGLTMSGTPAQASFEHCLFANNGVSPVYRYDTSHPTNISLANHAGTQASVEFSACTVHAVGSRLLGDGDINHWPTLVRGSGTSLEAIFTNCIFSGTGAEEAFDLRDDATEFGPSNVVWLRQCAAVFQGAKPLGHINALGAGTMILDGLRLEDPAFPNVNRPPGDESFDVTNLDFETWGPGGMPLTGWGDFHGRLVGVVVR